MNLKEKTKKNLTKNKPDTKILEIEKLLLTGNRILLVSHVDPDGDAVGTLLAFAFYLKDIGKDYVLVRDSGIPHKYKFLPGIEQIKSFKEIDQAVSFDVALVLECPTLERAGRTADLISDNTAIINIDHHQDATEYGIVNWLDTRASSVGEMAFEYFEKVGFSLSPQIAEQLYTAILTDTGRFRYTSTTPRTMAVTGELIAAGANPRKICDEVYYNTPPDIMKLTAIVLNTIEFHLENKFCLLHMTREMLNRSGADGTATEGLVDFTMFNTRVAVGALLKEIDENKTKISLRSRDNINVAEIADRFNGGGHVNAAGCTIARSIPEVREILIKILTEVLDGRA